ncbi:hypothetical protein RhiirB3_490287 [Rhizophagus irregularis]|nr:hypothetical protein RhiirB3_490287 [Rhizophagus irregularis]
MELYTITLMLTRLFLPHCVPKRLLWKNLVWTHKHNYSIYPENKDITRFNIDLRVLDDYPTLKNVVIRMMFEFQHRLWEEMHAKQKEYFEKKEAEKIIQVKKETEKIIQEKKETEKIIQEKKETEKIIQEKNEDEKIIQEKNEAEELMLQEKKKIKESEYEADKLKLLKENVDKVNNLNIQIEKLENEVEKYKKYKQQCILEFIRAQSLQSSTEKTKPLNKILEQLSQDKQFTLFLEKVCEKNDFQYTAVQRCAEDFHQTVSKSFQTYNPCVKIIDARSWTRNEVLLLGAIYHHYKIPFIYHDNENNAYAANNFFIAPQSSLTKWFV